MWPAEPVLPSSFSLGGAPFCSAVVLGIVTVVVALFDKLVGLINALSLIRIESAGRL